MGVCGVVYCVCALCVQNVFMWVRRACVICFSLDCAVRDCMSCLCIFGSVLCSCVRCVYFVSCICVDLCCVCLRVSLCVSMCFRMFVCVCFV